MSRFAIDDRWRGAHGIGRFTQELMARLPELQPMHLPGRPTHPADPWRLGRALRRCRPAVFFTPGYNPPRRSPVPFVFCLHDLIHLYDPAESTAAKRAYYRWIVRPAGARAARVITVSEFSRRQILQWAGWPSERVVVAPNGVAREFHPDGAAYESDRPYLLYVGTHRPHKNVARLLEAFARSGLACDVRLHLTGESTPAERAIIQRHRLDESVVHTGVLRSERLAQRYRGALALVMPSLSEGFGLPALEAMACGTAVIGANAAALPEVIANAGLLVDPHETDAIADAMRRITEDAELRRRLEIAGVQRADGFTWDRTASIVGQVLREAASGCDDAGGAGDYGS